MAKDRYLHAALYNYTRKQRGCYDPEFDKQIRELRPDWFVSNKDITTKYKEQLLLMAKNNEERPHCDSPLGRAFINYISKNHPSYDNSFAEKIKKLNSIYCIKSDVILERKEQLLLIARKGKDRPTINKHPLGKHLCWYTSKTNSTYDKEFDTKIRQSRPDWFDTTLEHKNELLKMAKNKDNKPPKNTKLGIYLRSYISQKSKSYDANFTNKIIKLALFWVKNISMIDKGQNTRNKLLQMAKNKEPRPICKKHPLGDMLCHYTSKNSRCYNLEFDTQIRQLAPHWF